MCWSERTVLGCDTSAPRDARQFSGQVLATSVGRDTWVRSLIDDCQLVVSELVTNSIKSGCTVVTVSITVHRDWVHLEVYDDAPGMPRLVNADPFASNGRGLAITAAVAGRWGVAAEPPGKQVWVDLAIPGDSHEPTSAWCVDPVPTPG